MIKTPRGSMQVDDIKAGQLITITGYRINPEPQQTPSGIMPPNPKPDVSGLVIEVLAVSYPFIAGRHNGKVFPLDTRDYTFARVNKAYAKALSSIPTPKPPKRPAKPIDKACDYCHFNMIPKWVGEGQWVYVCPLCDMDLSASSQDPTTT